MFSQWHVRNSSINFVSRFAVSFFHSLFSSITLLKPTVLYRILFNAIESHSIALFHSHSATVTLSPYSLSSSPRSLAFPLRSLISLRKFNQVDKMCLRFGSSVSLIHITLNISAITYSRIKCSKCMCVFVF